MVFESIVADLLNRFLGDYVDNLDGKQLNIGIWGGDVKLHNLDIKETALDSLDLPIKLKFGCLDRLILKIPWKNLYTEPVIANIEGLYLVVVPNKGVVYNEEKARKNEHENKQKSLARLEENRKNRRKPKDPSADTFTEKLVAQVIKNLQVKIRNIHVRYEDKYTDAKRPFAAGATLESLNFETTDSDWKATIHKETLNIFYKLVHLNNLAVYWNSHTRMITDTEDRQAVRAELENSISTAENGKHKDQKYVLEPIQMEARLKLNQKPETDGSNWSIPKVDLSVDLERLALGIGRHQYQDILLFLEAQERFNLAGRYLKYRPHLNEYKGHYREWWHFAYQSILEENIRRKKHNWSWTMMRKHRHMVREYRAAWVRKQTEKSLPSEIQDFIDIAERKLDVFNLNIARQQAELEIDRKGLTRVEDQPQGWGAWAKSWFSGGDKKPKEEVHHEHKEGDLISQFEQAMTPEEKAKLYDAIDYQENTPPTDYPKEYVENRVVANLNAIILRVEDTLELKFSDLKSLFEQRPSARAINLKNSIKSLSMSGEGKPMLELLDPSMDWLRLDVQTNPLKGDFDQFVALAIAPVILRYHAPAINTAAEVFKPPESVRLNQLTAAALAKYEDVKARSVTGLQHAVDTRSKLKMDIKIEPATIVISEGGIFDPQKPTLITELGLLTIQSTDKVSDDTYKDAQSQKHRELMIKAYDKFQIKLSNMQLLFSSNFDESMKAREDIKSPCHILRPTGLDIAFHMSSIDDLNIPKFRIYGDLPDIVVRMSDERLLQLAGLAFSIPTPKRDENELQEVNIAAPVEAGKLKDRAKMRAIMEVDEVDEDAIKRHAKETGVLSEDEGMGTELEESEEESEGSARNKELREQMVQVDVNLRLNQIGLEILRGDELVLAANIRELGFQLQMRTFDLVVQSHLGSITVEMPTFKSLLAGRETLFLIDNPKEQNTEHLMEMTFVQANKESPFFVTEYKKIQQNIEFNFKTLNVTLHQEALVNLKAYGEKVSEQLKEVQKQNEAQAKELTDGLTENVRKVSRSLSHLSLSSLASGASGTAQRKKSTIQGRQKSKEELFDESVINLRLNAQVTALKLLIGSNKGSDTSLDITGTKCSVTMRQKETHVQATLDSIQMLDETPNATHRKLLAVFGKKHEAMFQLDFTQTIRTDKERTQMQIHENDMAVRIRLAQLRFVFLNLWVNRMLHWINPFQEEAVAAAAQAKEIASEKAAETAQTVRKMLEENPQRILLDVELFAPAIVVPRRSNSHQVLLFDLGRLIVNNKFSSLRNAVIDNMEIQIKDVHAASGLLDKDSVSVSTKCNILRPLTFTLSVHRNLSFQLHKDVPELAVEAQFSLIDISLSQQDFSVIMQTLSGNLAEGTAPRPRPRTSSSTTTTQGKVEKPMETKSQPQRLASVAAQPGDLRRNVQSLQYPIDEGLTMDKPKVDYKRMVFQFRMDEIDMRLYEGETGLENGKGLIERSDQRLFSQLKLTKLKVGGWMTEQNAMDVAVSLHSFTMADKREGKTKVPHLLDKKQASPNELLLSLSYKQDSKGNQNVDINSSSIFLCLCPEFLGALASFFTVPKSEEQQKLEDAALAIRTGALTTSSGGTNDDKLQAKSTVLAPEDATIKPPTTLTLRGRINDIEVILIENSMEPETSQALVLSFNCTADVNNQDDVQQVEAKVCGLQIVSTYFANEKRHLVNYSVLQKLDIVLAGTVNTITKEQDFAVCIDSVHLKVSPSVIRLLSAVGASFSENRGTDDSKSAKVRTLKEYPNYWEPKKIEHGEYWWFTELGEEAVEQTGEPEIELATEVMTHERCEFTIDNFIITIEAGMNDTTMPMILLEAAVKGAAEDWTGKLSVDACLLFQVSYYNETFSVWEPVVEPVQREPGVWDRWQLNAKIRSHGEDELAEGAPGTRPTPMPKMTIDVAATEILNITVTKSFLRLLTNLGDAFEKASKQISPPKTRELPGNSPYLVMNDTGIDIQIRNSDTLKVSDTNEPVDATHGSFVDLDIIGDAQPIGLQPEVDRKSTELILQLLGTERIVDVHRAETRRIPLNKHADSGYQWHLVVDTDIENSRRVITLKSLVQFVNHMDFPIEIFTTPNSSTMNSCGVAKPNSKVPLSIPLHLLYTATGEFFFQPTDELYEISSESYSWYTFDEKTRHTLRCDHSSDQKSGIYLDLVVTAEEIRGERGRAYVDNLYTVHIYPPLQFRNLLPIDIHLTSPIEATIQGGQDIPLNVIAGQELQFWVEHNGEQHSTTLKLKEDPDDLEIVTLQSAINYELHLGAHWGTEYLRKECSIYAPYWTVNSTGKTISYVSEFEITHRAEQNPVLIPYPKKQIEGKKKAYLRVEDSDRSDEFPLDTVGNAGRITCKTQNGREYELAVDIQLCQSRLTKIVTFTAFYLLQNSSKFDIEVREQGEQEWIRVPAETCISLWPSQHQARKLLCARYVNQTEESVYFPFTENFEEFCPTNSKHLGFYVTCTVAESSSVINIDSFHPGMASALLINDTDIPIKFKQQGLPDEAGFELEPQHQRIFTYTDLSRKERALEWSSGSHNGVLSLLTDNLSSYAASNQNTYYYWASFLHGRQRTVLFTQDVSVATIAKEAFEVERMDQQIELSLHGLGISLVNNFISQEILYMGMSSSGIIWQQKIRARYRPFSVKIMEDIEGAYQKWIEKGRQEGFVEVGDSTINFQTMILKRKKSKNEVKIRREFQNGFYMMYRKSAHQTQIHMKLNHLQVDNQLPACVFPCVLAMVPPPRSVVADNEPKPFAEFSFIMNQSEHSNILQIKYLRLLVQEFDVRVDRGLVEAMLSLVESDQITVPYTQEAFKKDLELARPKLQEKVITTKASKQKSFYHDLHISPLMVHLSFSQGGTSKQKKPTARHTISNQVSNQFFSIFSVLMKSVGVTVTEIQDVVFKLAYFERKHTFYNQQQLQSEVQSHYTRQVLKQFYVLVLGLEILGNPYGLVVDVVGGVQDFFYQPFQGAIQGPEEFIEGTLIGFTSLFSHSVGGITGAASKITGTVGKGIAALTLDEDYQRKRQENINRRPQNFTEGMARGTENLVQGVVQGVTGVFTKPLEGARKGGAAGFVGGVGRGLLGAVARPLSGAVDFTSNTFNAVKNVATNAEEIRTLRPARWIPIDQIVRPYVYNEAFGYKIFRDTDKGYYADMENFIAHAYINEKNVFIVTNRRVLLSSRQSILGSWTTEWTHEFSELQRPRPAEMGVKLEFKQKKKGILGIGSSSGKGIRFTDKSVADMINEKLLDAYDNVDLN